MGRSLEKCLPFEQCGNVIGGVGSVRVDNVLVTERLRLGYAWDRILFFATGGYAWRIASHIGSRRVCAVGVGATSHRARMPFRVDFSQGKALLHWRKSTSATASRSVQFIAEQAIPVVLESGRNQWRCCRMTSRVRRRWCWQLC